LPVDAVLHPQTIGALDNNKKPFSTNNNNPATSPAPAGLFFAASAALGVAAIQARHAVVHHNHCRRAAFGTQLSTFREV
jgi:hypothetical protein